MSIGEVLASLRPSFPDVTISKIRFLESEGLVEPARTPSGYRKFSSRDVERLHYVLSAQRDQYLPLRVIKEHLDALDRGLEPSGVPGGRPQVPRAVVAGEGLPDLPGARSFGRDASEIRLSRAELIEAAGIDAALLTQIEGFGLVTAHLPEGAPESPTPTARGTRSEPGYYDADALVVAKTIAEMSEFGLEPRHLRAFRTAAEREASLVEQVVSPMLRQRDPDARARAEEAAREMGALSVKLHTALVRSALRAFVQR
jgi:DNA-binding transcriptional MerR regulator